MKIPKTNGSTDFFNSFSSTHRLLKKSEKVKNNRFCFFFVELWGNCGVEREKFLKNMWKNFDSAIFFHILWNYNYLKKWKYHCQSHNSMEFMEKVFKLTFQHYVEKLVEYC